MKGFLFLISMIFFVSCTEAQSTYKNISVKEFKQKISKEKNPQLIDVRTSAETDNGIIAGAKEIDIQTGQFEKGITIFDKSKPVYVYCAVGGRSARAAQIMVSKGFKEVYNLSGGMSAWVAEKQSVVKKN